MIGDPDQVFVTTGGLSRPTASATRVHHRHYPGIEVEGPSALEAAEALLRRLAAALDDTPNHWHRDQLEQAHDDAGAFVARSRRTAATVALPEGVPARSVLMPSRGRYTAGRRAPIPVA